MSRMTVEQALPGFSGGITPPKTTAAQATTTAATHARIKQEIDALLMPQPKDGSGKGDGEPQDGQGGDGGAEGGEGSGEPGEGGQGAGNGLPQPGETWDTEKGGPVKLENGMDGDVMTRDPRAVHAGNDKGLVWWMPDGTPMHAAGKKFFGRLTKRVEEPKSQPQPQGASDSAGEPQDPLPSEGEANGEASGSSVGKGGVGRPAGLDEIVVGDGSPNDAQEVGVFSRGEATIFSEGCRGRRRDGSAAGPFTRLNYSTEFPWACPSEDDPDEVDAYRNDGTYDVTAGRKSKMDIVEITKEAK